jgi:hypothetical protein
MSAIIRRFDRAPLEDKVLRANPAQPSKGAKGAPSGQAASGPAGRDQRNRNNNRGGRKREEPKSAFATELAKAL